MLGKKCKIGVSVFKSVWDLCFYGSYEHVEMKVLMLVDPMPQISSTDTFIHPWEWALNETARTKDSNLLDFFGT